MVGIVGRDLAFWAAVNCQRVDAVSVRWSRQPDRSCKMSVPCKGFSSAEMSAGTLSRTGLGR